ncbi:hypothetical protein SDC9_160144 [bioreactor metagenome]|uniref:Uncharacterized protein n=1 Tax=bioreactor metagenome TaxID=1076179 RepID=A0A645FK71_9ZZZZ
MGIGMVDGYSKCRYVIVRIVADHLRKPESFTDFLVNRHTDQPFAVYGHKIDIFRGRKLCRADEIAFVFTAFIICHNDYLSFFQSLQGFGNGIKLFHGLPPKIRFAAKILLLYLIVPVSVFQYIFRSRRFQDSQTSRCFSVKGPFLSRCGV